MQFTVTPDKDGMMLSRLLLQLADVPQWAVKQALKNRDVRVDGERVTGECARAGRTADSRILAQRGRCVTGTKQTRIADCLRE